MTKLFAQVETAAEIETAMAAGADMAGLDVNGHGVVGVLTGDVDKGLAAKPSVAGAMLAADAKGDKRLLDGVSVARIGEFVRRCHTQGLEAWLAGGLEAPDIPRLLPLKPDVLCFRKALRDGAGRLDLTALALIRDLIPRNGQAHRAPLEVKPGGRDRLFVHDLVLTISVGAYAKEHAKPQRVRFNVDAEIDRRAHEPRDMRDVFSYDLILDTINRVVAEGHVDLLETLAERIAHELLAHPEIARLTVKLEKLDIGPAILGIELVRERRNGR